MSDWKGITRIPGIRVGHAQDVEAITGVTVVLCKKGAVAGVDIRGGAPGTRETDCLDPTHLVGRVHAVCLSGGSAFGLDAAGGVMEFLEKKGVGFETGYAKVPIVPSAIIFDLGIGKSDKRPGKEMGFQAAQNAKDGPVEEGCAGAGTGATVGKLFGIEGATKSGVGTWSEEIRDGVVAGALTVVNAFGDVVDEKTGEILAGARDPKTGRFINTKETMKSGVAHPAFTGNTTLVVVATNAKLSKEQTIKLAQMSHNGIARVISPCHTMVDGDTVFALSIGDKSCDVSTLGTVAADVVAESIKRAVLKAASLGGVPSHSALKPEV